MADGSGAAGVLTLPKGGGALSGLGESFTPDLHTGTGNMTVPLTVPRGRNGFGPQLALVYSTGHGDDAFGLGWSLNVDEISRRTTKGIPRYDDSDVFTLAGSELVAVEHAEDHSRYRPRIESTYADIVHHHRPGRNEWTVRSLDGRVSHYGRTEAGSPPPLTASPDDPRHIFSWHLALIEDPFGNRISYEYEHDAGVKDAHRWDRTYLRRVSYIDVDDGPGAQRPLITVEFDYQTRPDARSHYRSGFEIRTAKRCSRIVVWSHAAVSQRIRTYELTYQDEIPAAETPAVSLLAKVGTTGHDGVDEQQMAPLEFRYQSFTPQGRRFQRLHGDDLPAASLADPGIELIDLFGNALPCLVELKGSIRFWRNLGDGTFDLPRYMPDAPAGVDLRDPGVAFFDADGDGHPDLLVNTDTVAGYFPLGENGAFNHRSFQRYPQRPTFTLDDPAVRLVDLDGDGVTDALRGGARFECFRHEARRGWTQTKTVARRTAAVFPDVDFADPRVRWADMTGDGMQAIVLIGDRRIDYWPQLGHGDWAPRVQMTRCPRLPWGYDPRRVLLGDVDGDGRADLVYVDDGKVTIWLNHGTDEWSPPIQVTGTPRVSDLTHLRMVDLLGTGVDGLLFSSLPASPHDAGLYYLDLTGGFKPYLLTGVDNNMGATTTITYAPSTRYYADDQKRRRTRWDTTLPIPVQVVAGIEIADHFTGGRMTSTFKYRHGAWDGQEREFCGFGLVEQADADDTAAGEHHDQPAAAPVRTRTWFHQGALRRDGGDWQPPDRSYDYWAGDPRQRPHHEQLAAPASVREALRSLRGRVLRRETFVDDNSARSQMPHAVAEFSYLIAELQPPRATADGVYAAFLRTQRDTTWDRGNDPMTRIAVHNHTRPDGTVDPYGRRQSTTSFACPRGWRHRADRPPDGYLATRECLSYADGPAGVYIHDRVASQTSFELLRTTGLDIDAAASRPDDNIDMRLFAQMKHFYDGPAFVGLPLGQAGRFGALVRSERLVLTSQIVDTAYGPDVPPYLQTSPAPAWPAHYPTEFRDTLAPRAGYLYRSGSADPGDPAGYFAQETRCRYDFHSGAGRGLLREVRGPTAAIGAAADPGSRALIDYDDYQLLVVRVTDAAGLSTTARHDYRALKPHELTDPNGNRSILTYTPLGLLKSIAHRGKSPAEGDVSRPGLVMTYGLDAFHRSAPDGRQPIFVTTTRQVYHDTDSDVGLPQRNDTITTVEYSDGFGRLMQVRTQAEGTRYGDLTLGGGDTVLPASQDAPTVGDLVAHDAAAGSTPVVVSGAHTYDHKGRIIEQYPPYFADGWHYAPARQDAKGRHLTLVHDPLGRLIATVTPDAARKQTIYGVPGAVGAPDVSRPDRFEPTPWETYCYDPTDNAERTHPLQSGSYAHHWDTPCSTVVDALGRTVIRVERNRRPLVPLQPAPPPEELRTTMRYDIAGNLLSVTDPENRTASTAGYDLAGRQLWEDTPDDGRRSVVVDAGGQPIETRDGKDALRLIRVDRLGRVDRIWARDRAAAPMTTRVRIDYGDAGRPDQPAVDRDAMRTANALGRPARIYDEAGLCQIDAYDHMGNVSGRTRRVLSDAALLATFAAPPANWQIDTPTADWSAPAAGQLQPQSYSVRLRFDALGRQIAQTLPAVVDGSTVTVRTQYNAAGLTERLTLERATPGRATTSAPIVERIAYNANGQRVLVVHGNDTMTRYAYEPDNFLIARVRSERVDRRGSGTLHPYGGALQDRAYDYDVAGNLLSIQDRTPGCGIPATPDGADRMIRRFSYDAVHQLISATGRCATTPAGPPWTIAALSADPTRTHAYTQTYEYNAVGAMTRLRHHAGPGSFTRNYTMTAAGNRLRALSFGPTTYDYSNDGAGNITSETTSRHFTWDHNDRMTGYRNQTAGAEPSIFARYFYGYSGERVMKWVRHSGGALEVTIMIDGVLEHCRRVQAGSVVESAFVRIGDGDHVVAQLRLGPAMPGDPTPAATFMIDDAVRAANLTLGGATPAVATDVVDREEFTPYGETSFGSYGAKRYRYAGQQRDEESGVYYFGARFYMPWACRFASTDPLGAVDGLNLYGYARNSPLVYHDPDGRQAVNDNQLKPGERDPISSPHAATESYTMGDVQGMVVTGDANAPLPYELPESNPVALKKAEGQGHIELGDWTHFFKGLWNGPSGWVNGPQFQVDPYHAGAHEAGSQLGKNLVIEAATAGVGKVVEWAAPAVRSGGRGGRAGTQLAVGDISGGMSAVDPKKEKLWLDWLTRRGVRVERGTKAAEEALDATEKARKLAPDTVRGMTQATENAQGGKDVVIYLREGYNAAEFYEECLHAYDMLKGRQATTEFFGVVIDLLELRAKLALLNPRAIAARGLSREEVRILKQALIRVLTGRYP